MSKTYQPYEVNEQEALGPMDPDFQIHALTVLADYHTHIDHQFELGNLDAGDWAYESYLLGNMEGRVFANAWGINDYEQLAIWEQDVATYREEHGGTLFPDLMK